MESPSAVDRFALWLVGLLGAWFVRILGWTIRMPEPDRTIPGSLKSRHGRVVYVLSHGQLFLAAHLARKEPIVTLISQHRDGEYASRIASRLGIPYVRGSSTRGGGVALFRLLRSPLYRGYDIGITPDGPRGPLLSVKRGVILLAKRLGCPILPVAIRSSSFWEFGSWDRFRVPRPFSRAVVRFGRSISIGADAGEEELERIRGELEREMLELNEEEASPFASRREGRHGSWSAARLGEQIYHAGERYLARRDERWWTLPLSLVLIPFERAWWLSSALRNFLYRAGFLRGRRLTVPVVSVGNLMLGGTGKTILVSALTRLLSQRGYRPAILTRGYGGNRGKGISVVRARSDSRNASLAMGDEPVFLARQLPDCTVIRGRDRYLSGLYAITRFGCDLCILDDGFQYRRLQRDIDIVLVRGEAPFGNGRLFPLGPLREGPGGMKRADLIARCWRWGEREEPLPDVDPRIPPGLPVLEISLVAERIYLLGNEDKGIASEEIRRMSVLAFAGIGDPISFRRLIESWSPRRSGFVFFPDHHGYPARSVDRLNRAFDRMGADLMMTTEKDAIKLDRDVFEGRPCGVISVSIRIESGSEALEELLSILPRSRGGEGVLR